MFTYLKILQVFVLSILFQKDELNFKSKSFKPVKILLVMLAAANVSLSVYLVKTLYRVHNVIVAECPQIYVTEVPAILKEKRLPTVK